MGARLNGALSSTAIRSNGKSLFTERPCQGAGFHSPRPLTTSIVKVAGSDVDLCGTCRDNLEAYIVLNDSYPQDITWELSREFGNKTRALGQAATRKEDQ